MVDLSEEVQELLDYFRPPDDSLAQDAEMSLLHVPPAPPVAARPCCLPAPILPRGEGRGQAGLFPAQPQDQGALECLVLCWDGHLWRPSAAEIPEKQP